MAKKAAIPVVLIRNMADGPRDYPLRDGSSIYLPPRGKPIHWEEIPEDAFSPALALAEKKGLIQVQRAESTANDANVASEAATEVKP